jgi:hypothetical protein
MFMCDHKPSTKLIPKVAIELRRPDILEHKRPMTLAPTDLVETMWREFSSAHACAQKLTRRQQAIESMLLEHIGIRTVNVDLPDDGYENSGEPEDPGKAENVSLNQVNPTEGKTTTLAARWAAADAQLGYSAALRAEAKALTRARDLAERLWATPAVSLTGTIAKLDALLSEGPPSSTSPEFPWPQLRAIRLDLERLRVTRPLPPGR